MFRRLIISLEKLHNDTDYPNYAKSISGTVIGYALRTKAALKNKKISDAKLKVLDTRLQSIAKTTKDDKFKKIKHTTSNDAVYSVVNTVVLVIEATKKELDELVSGEHNPDTISKMKELVNRIYRGKYIISTIAKFYKVNVK